MVGDGGDTPTRLLLIDFKLSAAVIVFFSCPFFFVRIFSHCDEFVV